jgi:hypothetical protein
MSLKFVSCCSFLCATEHVRWVKRALRGVRTPYDHELREVVRGSLCL